MKVIIPMTGKSKRFKNAGIDLPKQFLEIENKMIAQHILDMFPGESDINFIINKDDAKNYEIYYEQFPEVNIVQINFQSTGPGGALLESKLLDTDESVLINYCDFANIWDWQNLKNFIESNNPDGLVPAYVGLHPHTVYENDYAFIKNQDFNILGIQEKKPFTDNKQMEYASTGTYYFKSGWLAKKYINKTFEDEDFINNEVYISTPFQKMINENLDVKLYKIDYFFQWGTPEDYQEFKYNINEVKNVYSSKKIEICDMNFLIPAAGESSRFKKENYNESKIFLDVNGSSIVKTIVDSFECSKNIKVLVQDKDFDEKKFKDFEEVDIVKIAKKTNGQAESALKLVNLVKNEDPIFIHSSDCVMDKDTMIPQEEYYVVVFTKKNYRRGHFDSFNYGWVNSSKNKIKSLSIKKKPDDNSSTVIIGNFLFKNKNTYIDIYNETLINNQSINEIHIDHMLETALNKKMKVIEVSSEKSLMLGIPLEYKLFRYMKNCYEYLKK